MSAVTKWNKVFIALGVTLSLSACMETAPKLTEEQKAAQRIQTLNVYPDNWFIYEFGEGKYRTWAWSENKDEILALEVNDSLYNASDIRQIIVKKTKNIYLKPVTVVLKNGKNLTANAGKDSKTVPRWRKCDAQKKCSRGRDLTDSDLSVPFKVEGFIKAIGEGSLSRSSYSSMSFSMDPKYSFMSDYRVFPRVYHDTVITFLDEDGQQNLQKRIAAMDASYGAEMARRHQKQERVRQAQIERDKQEEAEAHVMRKSIRVGTQTNCGAVFDVRLPMIGVQTIHGMQFLDINTLYGPSANCRFINGKYVGR